MKFSLVAIFALCILGFHPAASISRWFSASYQDLRVTMHRYGHCVGELQPFKDQNLNETEYLIQQAKTFLEHAALGNEQLLNLTALMDQICPPSPIDGQPIEYPISVHLNVSHYNNPETGKINRCRAIDEIMDRMFYVFKLAAWNKSEPLDFSIIQFHPNGAQQGKEISYNLTDLINTSWIASNAPQDLACRITDSIKMHIAKKISTSEFNRRSESSSYFKALLEFIDGLLNPILGSTRRFYWDSYNAFEIINSRIGTQLGNLRNGLGSRYNRAKDMLVGVFSSSNSTLVTNSTRLNSTSTSTSTSTTATTPLPRKPTVPMPLNKTSPAAAAGATTTTPTPVSTPSKRR